MQLLYSRAAPGPEFASLSVLAKGDISGDQISCQLSEPLVLPSSVSTMSHSLCVEAIMELHIYLNSILKATKPGKQQTNKLAAALLQEDERLLRDIQVYRPMNGQGMGLHYRLLQDPPAMSALIPLVPNASKARRDITGVVMCVGMTGMPSAFVMSSLHYSLNQRMTDCVEIMSKTGTEDASSCRALLSTLLLTEDETRLTNAMADAVDHHLFADADETGGLIGRLGTGKRKNHDATEHEGENPLGVNSADQARITVERLAVLSVAERDTIFRKFEGKTNEKTSKTRRRKGTKEADLDGFDFSGEKKSSREEPSTAVSALDSLGSPASSKLQLRQPKKDTARIVGKGSRQASVPALLASNKDKGGIRTRRSSVEMNGKPGMGAPVRRQSDTSSQQSWGMGSNGNAFSDTGKQGGGGTDFDPFAAGSDATVSTTSETTVSSRKTRGAFDTDGDMAMDAGFGKSARPAAAQNDSSPKVLVNVALNEDLTCFYKLSKMSSCSVEGVIQVQVKANTEQQVPFHLLIRDPSGHLQSIQENKKFAEDLAASLGHEPASQRPDHKYTVSVPRGENYFPVMRYKCENDLRPVPIRVQTRVRMESSNWRVALQISSNPHNEDSLTDLTIIMGVPQQVRGESLTTSPAGGVWNASKRSVIWCVSELGGGEKFQLQARFDGDPNAASDGDLPKFPVLVRCQCMHAQLSDVQLEVKDIPGLPADVRMKLARRFRLSHRERP